MLISDQNFFPIIIENIEVPHKTDMFWTFNLENKDFMLSPLLMFEEQTCKMVMVMEILGFKVEIPSYWNLLIYSEDTSQLDIHEIHEISRGYFTAVVFDHKKNRVIPGPVSIIDCFPDYKVQTVNLHKNAMLCHPLGPDYWICIAQSDNYNKYLKNAVIGDLS